ncbi:MAG: hypothetical protein GXO24_05230 [Chlorobi bacterium]|nr:hypothetical protein [Chlorobiota bacterium]
MRAKDLILVLKRIPHKDHTFVLDTLSRTEGRKSFILRAGLTKAGKRHRALAAPMQLLQVEYLASKSGWARILHMHPEIFYRRLHADPRRTAMGLFMIENIRQLVREGHSEDMFDRFADFFIRLDREPYRPGFHLEFMSAMLEILGIKPQPGEFGTFFDRENDMKDLRLQEIFPDAGQRALFLRFLAGDAMKNRAERREVLQLTGRYVAFHYGDYRLPKTLEVYKEVFDEE